MEVANTLIVCKISLDMFGRLFVFVHGFEINLQISLFYSNRCLCHICFWQLVIFYLFFIFATHI